MKRLVYHIALGLISAALYVVLAVPLGLMWVWAMLSGDLWRRGNDRIQRQGSREEMTP